MAESKVESKPKSATKPAAAPEPATAKPADASADPAQISPDDLDALLSAASAEAQAGAPPGSAGLPDPLTSEEIAEQPLELAELGGPMSLPVDARRISMLSDVNLNVKIELGRTRMLVEDVLRLGEGSVVELDKLAGDPVDVYANDRLVARGEVLVLNDSFCVRINEVLSRDPHRVTQG